MGGGQAQPTDLPILPFADAAAMEAFLDEHHASIPGLYAKLAKKASGIPSISKEAATEVGLCFGWIDGGGGKGIDEKWHLVRFTPRRPKSIWSQKNVDTVQRLTDQGRMREAGLAAVAAAKADGRWDRAYATPTNMTTPPDFAAALEKEPAAKSFFETFSRSERYSTILPVEIASPAARAGRIRSMIEKLAKGEKPTPAGGKRKAPATTEKSPRGKKAPTKGKKQSSGVVKAARADTSRRTTRSTRSTRTRKAA